MDWKLVTLMQKWLSTFEPNVKLISFLSDPKMGAAAVFGMSLASTALTSATVTKQADPSASTGSVLVNSLGGGAAGAMASAGIYYFLLRPTGILTSAKWRRIAYASYFILPPASIVANAFLLALSDTGAAAGSTVGGFAAIVTAAVLFHKYIEPLSLATTGVPGGLVSQGMAAVASSA